jgi:uncharacterized RDD family membrane protein YckC
MREDRWYTEPVHPWRRYFARSIDYYSVGLLCYMGLCVILYGSSSDIDATAKLVENQFFAAVANVVLCVPGLAVLIGLTGTTPGKWLAGIRVLGLDGQPAGIGRAFVREVHVALRGMGLSLPLIVLICNVAAHTTLTTEKTTSWDRELDFQAWYQPTTAWTVIRMLLGMAVCAIVLGSLAALGKAAG